MILCHNNCISGQLSFTHQKEERRCQEDQPGHMPCAQGPTRQRHTRLATSPPPYSITDHGQFGKGVEVMEVPGHIQHLRHGRRYICALIS